MTFFQKKYHTFGDVVDSNEKSSFKLVKDMENGFKIMESIFIEENGFYNDEYTLFFKKNQVVTFNKKDLYNIKILKSDGLIKEIKNNRVIKIKNSLYIYNIKSLNIIELYNGIKNIEYGNDNIYYIENGFNDHTSIYIYSNELKYIDKIYLMYKEVLDFKLLDDGNIEIYYIDHSYNGNKDKKTMILKKDLKYQ